MNGDICVLESIIGAVTPEMLLQFDPSVIKMSFAYVAHDSRIDTSAKSRIMDMFLRRMGEVIYPGLLQWGLQ